MERVKEMPKHVPPQPPKKPLNSKQQGSFYISTSIALHAQVTAKKRNFYSSFW